LMDLIFELRGSRELTAVERRRYNQLEFVKSKLKEKDIKTRSEFKDKKNLELRREMLSVVGKCYLQLAEDFLRCKEYETLRHYNALNYLDKGLKRFGDSFELGKSLPDGHQASVWTHARWVLDCLTKNLVDVEQFLLFLKEFFCTDHLVEEKNCNPHRMRNCLFLKGRSETAKTLISELICSPMTSATIGRRLNSEDEFEVDADALLEPINAVCIQDLDPNLNIGFLKWLLGGESIPIHKKDGSFRTLNSRYPVVCTSVHSLKAFVTNEIHLMCLENRCHEIFLFVPIFETTPTVSQKPEFPPGVPVNALPFPHLVRPRFNIGGETLLAMYAIVFEGVDLKDLPARDPNKPLQNLPFDADEFLGTPFKKE